MTPTEARQGDAIVREWAVLTALVLILAAVATALVPDRAGAQGPAACPPAVATPAESDPPEVAQVKQLRADTVQTCEAVAGRLDVLDTGTTAVREHLAEVNDALDGTLKVETQGPTGPSGPAPEVIGTQTAPEWVRLAGEDGDQLYSVRYGVFMLLGAVILASAWSLIRRAMGL